MSEQFLGEIRIMSFGLAPKGWALCNGQLLPINQNQALFALLGTTYGGNGQTNFALPDLRSRVPLHFGNGFTLGQSGGQEAHTLTLSEMPAHNHFVMFSTQVGTTPNATTTSIPARAGTNAYGPLQSAGTMNPQALGTIGGNQPHENRQPFLTLSFCIALQGIFPSRS
ncbi:MAG: tail fiber protein [Anaerolineae bacterium]|nr:tail fiber protein [Anaerolineae bacterium]